MKAAQTWPTNKLFRVASANGGTPRRSSLVEPEMGAILMVVTYVFGQQPLQMPPISHDHVVQEVPPTASDPALGYAVLHFARVHKTLRTPAQQGQACSIRSASARRRGGLPAARAREAMRSSNPVHRYCVQRGICTRCKRRPARAGRTRCARCTRTHSALGIGLYNAAKREGRCTRCKRRKARKLRTRCAVCEAAHYASKRKGKP
jgi:hypothetical protein